MCGCMQELPPRPRRVSRRRLVILVLLALCLSFLAVERNTTKRVNNFFYHIYNLTTEFATFDDNFSQPLVNLVDNSDDVELEADAEFASNDTETDFGEELASAEEPGANAADTEAGDANGGSANAEESGWTGTYSSADWETDCTMDESAYDDTEEAPMETGESDSKITGAEEETEVDCTSDESTDADEIEDDEETEESVELTSANVSEVPIKLSKGAQTTKSQHDKSAVKSAKHKHTKTKVVQKTKATKPLSPPSPPYDPRPLYTQPKNAPKPTPPQQSATITFSTWNTKTLLSESVAGGDAKCPIPAGRGELNFPKQHFMKRPCSVCHLHTASCTISSSSFSSSSSSSSSPSSFSLLSSPPLSQF